MTEDYAVKEQKIKNRTLWIRDNLEVMRGMNSEIIDLIYLDPPFNSKQIYNAPLGSKAAGAKFTDTWTMDSMKAEWIELQEEADPAIFHCVEGAGLAAGDSMQAYMCFMAPRLQECHRVLKPTGSIYLHCDPTASHYLKQLLDIIFGNKQFRNEVIWYYTNVSLTPAHRWFQRKHDTILFYSKTNDYKFTNPRDETLSGAYKARWGRYTEADGQTVLYGSIRHQKATAEAAARSIRKREKREPKDTDVARIVLPALLRSVWKIPAIPNNTRSKESTGWPTQKPLALLERIIKASSNEGDLVFDPFCGCATAMVAAEKLGRRWVGCDIDEVATGITLHRLQDFADDDGDDEDATIADKVKFPKRPPKRNDSEAPKRSKNIREVLWNKLEGVMKIGDNEMRECPGCGRPHYRDTFHLDHIVPKSKGGPDVDANLQLLCPTCNQWKSNTHTMAELHEHTGFTPQPTEPTPEPTPEPEEPTPSVGNSYSPFGDAASGHDW